MSLRCQNPNDFPFVPTSPKSILACKRVGIDPTDLLLQNKTLNNQVMEQYHAITKVGTTFSEKMSNSQKIFSEPRNNTEESSEKIDVDYIVSKEARFILSSKRDQRALRKYQEIEHKRRQLCKLKETLSSRQIDLRRPIENQQQLNIAGTSLSQSVSSPVENQPSFNIQAFINQAPMYESPLEIEIRNLQNYARDERQTNLEISTLNSDLTLAKELLRHSNVARNKQLEFVHSQHQLRNYLASKHQTESIVLARRAERTDLILLNSQINNEKRSQAQLQRRLLEQQRLNRALQIQEHDAIASVKKLQWQERKVSLAIAGCKVEGIKYMWREINNKERQNNSKEQLKGLRIELRPQQSSCYLTQNPDSQDTSKQQQTSSFSHKQIK